VFLPIWLSLRIVGLVKSTKATFFADSFWNVQGVNPTKPILKTARMCTSKGREIGDVHPKETKTRTCDVGPVYITQRTAPGGCRRRVGRQRHRRRCSGQRIAAPGGDECARPVASVQDDNSVPSRPASLFARLDMNCWSFRCPICDRRFMDDTARRRHLLDSKRCNIIEECLRLQFLLADREEALAVARRQRDEAREAGRFRPLTI
jgi:hypothetical protein